MDNEIKISNNKNNEALMEKLLGKTCETIGKDINELYIFGRDKILEKLGNKIENKNDGYTANLRVTRDVFWNGSFSDENICAEYFAGTLAGSRSEDGKNDDGIFYLDLIKALSSKQLHFHYIIYNELKELCNSEKIESNLNVFQESELNKITLGFKGEELLKIGINPTKEAVILYNKGLINMWSSDGKIISLQPTSLGILLFLQAHNKLDKSSEFASKTLKLLNFENIKTPKSIN